MDERTALEAMAAGDETALGWFIGRYAAYAATIINNMLLPRLSEADAEEALADVFVSLWRSAARIRPEGGADVHSRHRPQPRPRRAQGAHSHAPRSRTTYCPCPRPGRTRR